MVTNDAYDAPGPDSRKRRAWSERGKQGLATRVTCRSLSRVVALLAATAVLVLGAPLVVGAPSAWACSCPAAAGQLSQPTPRDVVLEGRVLDGESLVSGETVWTVQVARVFRGQATTVQPVVSQSNSASCGLELRVGEPYLVDATTDRDRPGLLRTGLCSATTPLAELTPAERRDNERLLGPGRSPFPGEPAHPTPVTTTQGVSLLVVAAVVSALSIAGALLLIRRRRAR